MTTQLVSTSQHEPSQQKLQALYDQRLVAPEKKPFLIDLERSFGNYLAIEGSDEFIFDGCSQIATVGLGFNASPLFGTLHHAESWTGNYTTDNIQRIANAYRNLLIRMLGQPAGQHRVRFCASGAEAVETALGACFDARTNRSAKKVLAFEGSFHGRTMVALASTWNAKKREPFAWPGYESGFAPYPEVKCELKCSLCGADCDSRCTDQRGTSAIEQAEKASLDQVAAMLDSGEYFAVLIEPMQCEGGDRYSRPEFHRRLRMLTRAKGIPLVYDEVQTGFHLGSRFFWHSQFGLQREDGTPDAPDVICCAKKAQVGVVISQLPIAGAESFCPASLIRGYAVASMLDQYEDRIGELAEQVARRLRELVARHSRLICNPRGQGTAFAFDFHDPELLMELVKNRFESGLLLYPAGSYTARFRLSLSPGGEDLSQFWQQLDRALEKLRDAATPSETAASGQPVHARSKSAHYQFHSEITRQRQSRMSGHDESQPATVVEYLQSKLQSRKATSDLNPVLLSPANYADWRERILQMQLDVYEPVRQSPPEEFDCLFDAENSIDSPALLLESDGQIAAMAFCGPLGRFRQERGVSEDPFVDDDRCFYMLDVTVAPDRRGKGLGRIIKNAIALLATDRGVTAIHGRNRDRLARAMWAINLGLGSFELQHLKDDYPDDGEHRDCLYYRCPLAWESHSGSELPFPQLDLAEVDAAFFTRNAPAMVNKLCLSNFVTSQFIEDLETTASILPKPLQHLYTASSLSESIDKITKVLWRQRQPRTGLLTIEGHQFGGGTFLSRSLSAIGNARFEVVRMPAESARQQLHQLAATGDQWLGLFIEAERYAEQPEELAEIVRTSGERSIPVVLNETGTRFGSDQQLSRVLHSQFDATPDAGVAWLGGQMALTYCRDELFAADPLLLISTWDGDAYGLARFAETIRQRSS